MADEREDRYESQEEGEYHFSDDQSNYALDEEVTEPSKVTKVPVFGKEGFTNKILQYRRYIIGAVIFLFLLGAVFTMLVPGSTPPTDFSQQTVVPPKPPVVTKKVTPPPPPVVSAPAMPVSPPQTVAPVIQPNTTTVTSTMPETVPASSMNNAIPVSTQTGSPVVTTVAGASPPSLNESPSMPQGPFAQTPPVSQPATVPSQTTVISQGDAQTVINRLASLEQQNTAMMNLLQTEYAQKIADYETQQTAMRGKLEELTKRANRMESNLNQLIQVLRGSVRSSSVQAAPGVSSSSSSSDMKMNYSVQAIIPGRAWLKSESGDTVTVAEGDILRGYGRVTKIDPYDGVVNIDTGNKVVTLSYGIAAE